MIESISVENGIKMNKGKREIDESGEGRGKGGREKRRGKERARERQRERCDKIGVVSDGLSFIRRVWKVGVGIRGDAVRLSRDLQRIVRSCLDLSELDYSLRGLFESHEDKENEAEKTRNRHAKRKSQSLSSLTKVLLHHPLPKPDHLRKGNWSVSSQQNAHANDAIERARDDGT